MKLTAYIAYFADNVQYPPIKCYIRIYVSYNIAITGMINSIINIKIRFRFLDCTIYADMALYGRIMHIIGEIRDVCN